MEHVSEHSSFNLTIKFPFENDRKIWSSSLKTFLNLTNQDVQMKAMACLCLTAEAVKP
jgi:hypothetical protein